jgi:sulfate permease, SulP family
MAGILLVVVGATGMGTGVKFIPWPVVIGFTNGIAVLIASTQVKDFFGLHLERVQGVFWLRMKVLAASFPTWSPTATILAVATVATMLVCRVLSKAHSGTDRGDAGSDRHSFFSEASGRNDRNALRWNPQRPSPHGDSTLACRAGSWTARAGVHCGDAGCNRVATTGAIARTATNICSGAQSPIAGMIHSLTLLCVLLFAAPLASYIPMVALAGILMIVAYNMGEWREIPQLLRLTKTDISIWLVTLRSQYLPILQLLLKRE